MPDKQISGSMFKASKKQNKLHLIFLILQVLSIIVALTIETVFSNLKDT